jgi:molecular chaperone DnaK
LSSLLETKINIPFITATETGPKHIDMTLTREKFEGLCEDLINRCEGPFDKALKDGSVSKKDIDEIVLVGGSTRIPAIQNLIEKLVGKKPDFSVNPDEAVAIGAALQGAIISGSLGDIMLIDVLPLSLGVEVEGGLTSRMITRNSAVPTDHTETYTTPSKNYERVTITVLQGEREFARDNKKIGEFELSGLKPSPMGKPSIDVKFEVDENCTLNVTAIDLATKSENSIVIKDTSQLSSDEIAKMVSEGESWEREDKKKKVKS